MPSDKSRTITERESPSGMVDSGYGRITYRVWCEKEMQRMNGKSNNLEVHIHEFSNGDIALVRGKKVTK